MASAMISSKRVMVSPILLLLAAGIAVGSASAQPATAGQWVTAASIHKTLVGRPVQVMTCDENPCTPFVYNGHTSIPPVLHPMAAAVNVQSAVVTGIGASHLLAHGLRGYQLFHASICAIDYMAGGARVRVSLLWHARRPATSTTTTANGITGTSTDSGAPYAEDWQYRGMLPLAGTAC